MVIDWASARRRAPDIVGVNAFGNRATLFDNGQDLGEGVPITIDGRYLVRNRVHRAE